MSTRRGTPDAASAADTAAYICSLARELREIATKNDLGFLAYLLAMVVDEAEATIQRSDADKSDAA